MSDRFALIVVLKVQPGKGDAFLPHIVKNARASVAEEADCHQFQVLRNTEAADSFVFHEVYSDKDAWLRHRETPHFLAFNDATKDMVVERHFHMCDIVQG